MLIGYARVSKADGSQSLDLQHDALRAAGVERDNIAIMSKAMLFSCVERLWLGAAGCSRTLPRRFCLRLGGIARFQTGGIGRRVAVDGQARSEHERIT